MKKSPLLVSLYILLHCILAGTIVFLYYSLNSQLYSLLCFALLMIVIILPLSAILLPRYSIFPISFAYLAAGFFIYQKFNHPTILLNFLMVAIISLILFLFSRTLVKEKIAHNIEKLKLEEQINTINKKYEHDKEVTRALLTKVRRFESLRDISESLSTTLSLDEMTERMLYATVRTIKHGDCWRLFLLKKDLKSIFLYKERYLTDYSTKIASNPHDKLNRWIVNNRIPLIIKDLKCDFRFDQEDENKFINSMISAPLITDNKIIGIVRVESFSDKVFQVEDLRILSIIATLSAISIKNIYLYEETHELSITDGLTSLFVQTYFREKLQESLDKKDISQLSLILLDIDNFKKLNDTYGHIVGDKVLMAISQTIREVASEHSVIARYGGEEFAVLYTDIPPDKVNQEAEMIRGAIEKKPFLLRREKISLTVSVGVAHHSGPAIPKENMIKLADDSLYKAKKQGKNRVVIAK